MLNPLDRLVLLFLSAEILTTILLHERDHSVLVLQFHQPMLEPNITCYSKLSGSLVILYPASGMQWEQTYCNVASITGTHSTAGSIRLSVECGEGGGVCVQDLLEQL